MKTTTIHISGMACGGCANTIAQVLQSLDGVASAQVSHHESTAIVTYDEARIQPETMHMAIQTAGYQVNA